MTATHAFCAKVAGDTECAAWELMLGLANGDASAWSDILLGGEREIGGRLGVLKDSDAEAGSFSVSRLC